VGCRVEVDRSPFTEASSVTVSLSMNSNRRPDLRSIRCSACSAVIDPESASALRPAVRSAGYTTWMPVCLASCASAVPRSWAGMSSRRSDAAWASEALAVAKANRMPETIARNTIDILPMPAQWR